MKITESISDIQKNILIDKHQTENELSQGHTHTHTQIMSLVKYKSKENIKKWEHTSQIP